MTWAKDVHHVLSGDGGSLDYLNCGAAVRMGRLTTSRHWDEINCVGCLDNRWLSEAHKRLCWHCGSLIEGPRDRQHRRGHLSRCGARRQWREGWDGK